MKHPLFILSSPSRTAAVGITTSPGDWVVLRITRRISALMGWVKTFRSSPRASLALAVLPYARS